MPTSYTPLRYPGGKAKLGPYLSALLQANNLVDSQYAEPYAGGAGAGLFLLFRGYVSSLRLNDIDRCVVAFWRAVLNHNEAFARRVERASLTVNEWDRQREVVRSSSMGEDLGFAFFYLNRTNHSGIMNAGIIGGRKQQGPWSIDARFNRKELAGRIRAIGAMRRHISVARWDALDFLDDVQQQKMRRMFVYLDPPYYKKGHELYTNFYGPHDHATIAEHLELFTKPWMMTYDDCAAIRRLYRGHRLQSSTLSYSARRVRRGREVVIYGASVVPPGFRSRRARGNAGFSIVRTRADI